MNQEINDLLLNDLEEAQAQFDIIVDELKDKNIPYSLKDIVTIENNSYRISLEAIKKMNDSLVKYQALYNANIEFFDGEAKIFIKYVLLYIVSIIMIKVFSKTLSTDKINEMWYGLVGMVLGSANLGMINSNLNSYRYHNKENRELMNEINSLQEEYNNNFDIARREISYMFSLNRNLDKIDINEKEITKKIKGI